MEAVGTVQVVSESTVTVEFKGLDETLCKCVSSTLQKLNKYSVNQLVKIRSDAPTIQKVTHLSYWLTN